MKMTRRFSAKSRSLIKREPTSGMALRISPNSGQIPITCWLNVFLPRFIVTLQREYSGETRDIVTARDLIKATSSSVKRIRRPLGSPRYSLAVMPGQ